MKKKNSIVKQDLSDEQLVKKIQSGNHENFNILSKRYEVKLLRYIFKYTKNLQLAEDILQNTLIKTHKNIEKFNLNKKFTSWIYKIAYNETMTYLNKEKKNKKVLSLDNNGQIEDELFTPHDIESLSVNAWLKQELQNEMQSSIKKLPKKYRKIIYMRFIEDLSYQEISQSLNLPVSTIGTQIRRAKKQLLDIILSEQNLKS